LQDHAEDELTKVQTEFSEAVASHESQMQDRNDETAAQVSQLEAQLADAQAKLTDMATKHRAVDLEVGDRFLPGGITRKLSATATLYWISQSGDVLTRPARPAPATKRNSRESKR
jgi:hypothetical protein